MERLLPQSTLEKLSIPEIQLLIMSAFFHDIGMAPPDYEVLSWLSYWDIEPGRATASFEAFERFMRARPYLDREIQQLIGSGRHSQARTLQEYLVTDFIRENHADRARDIIASDWTGKIRYRETDLGVELATVCFSHSQNPLDLLELDAALFCAPGTFVCLPFIGVILRLADVLDFDAKRTPEVLFSHISVRHPVSLLEWQKHRAVTGWTVDPGRIAFAAKCEHPAIETAIRRFCDQIDRELAGSGTVLQHLSDPSRIPFPEYYRIPLPARVDRSRIQPRKDVRGNPVYEYRDTQFALSHRQVIDLLMGTSLYGDPAVAVRELVQNSIDACMLRQAMEGGWNNQYVPRISISFVEREGREFLIVEDNGTGMDQDIIDRYYSKVGSSFYRSADFFELQAQHMLRYKPISRFGIGVLSCFMVADSINVQTRRLLGPHDSSRPIEVRIEGRDSIFWILEGTREFPGTRTELQLREQHPWKGLAPGGRAAAVRALVPHPPIDIVITENGESTVVSTKDYLSPGVISWADSPHVRRIDFTLDDVTCGIVGSISVAILEEDGMPVDSITLFSREVQIDHESIELSNSLRSRTNEIERESDTLEVDDGQVSKNTSHFGEIRSEAEIAIHGIAIPQDLFPPRYRRARHSVHLNFPFPVRMQIDVVGERDLNLRFIADLVATCRGTRP